MNDIPGVGQMLVILAIFYSGFQELHGVDIAGIPAGPLVLAVLFLLGTIVAIMAAAVFHQHEKKRPAHHPAQAD